MLKNLLTQAQLDLGAKIESTIFKGDIQEFHRLAFEPPHRAEVGGLNHPGLRLTEDAAKVLSIGFQFGMIGGQPLRRSFAVICIQHRRPEFVRAVMECQLPRREYESAAPEHRRAEWFRCIHSWQDLWSDAPGYEHPLITMSEWRDAETGFAPLKDFIMMNLQYNTQESRIELDVDEESRAFIRSCEMESVIIASRNSPTAPCPASQPTPRARNTL